MEKKIVLSLLIQYIILFQAVESLSGTNSASWGHHVRKKRIIDISPNRNESFLNQDVRYVVPILNEPGLASGKIHCTGSILAPRIILTAGHCVVNEKCYVLTGGHRGTRPTVHKSLIQHVYEHFDKNVKKNDLALLILEEPIDLINSYHRAIELYNERTLPRNTHGIFSGWGSTSRDYIYIPWQAQSIEVEIISLQQCQQAYRSDPRIIITSHELCSYYMNREKCGWFGDSGGPLVVNGRIVGIFSWYEKTGRTNYPDVFTNLLNSDYKSWVENSVRHFLINYPN